MSERSSAFVCRVSARFFFDAAHRMPNFPPEHPNSWLHGHSYTGEVIVEGPVDPCSGFVMDHGRLEDLVQKIAAKLEHRYLNEIDGLELPTSEHLCKFFWAQLKPQVPGLVEVLVKRETRGITVSYRGPYLPRSDLS
jgi:6-pyruvoyltetrahydropterin/6-carboxytetrahydropterin synthase